MSSGHGEKKIITGRASWVPGDELFFQIVGAAIAIFLLKAFLA